MQVDHLRGYTPLRVVRSWQLLSPGQAPPLPRVGAPGPGWLEEYLPRMREKRTWTSARMLLIGSPFELSRGNITEPAMTTMRVIPPLEPRENLSASVVSCRETVSVQHFRLKAREKRLHHRVIEAVANATHGPRDAQFPATRGEGHSRVFLYSATSIARKTRDRAGVVTAR
jgi:hypothetical protein